MQTYNFPEKNKFLARDVLGANFDIGNYEYANLYVNLDNVRHLKFNNYRKNIKETLKIGENNILEALTDDYKKILFSGYNGSGKTIELRQLHKELNHPDRYFSIHIELEEELIIGTFQFEDYFILLIFKLARELEERNININTESLDAIIDEWLSEENIKTEIKKQAKIEGGAEVETGINILSFFKTKFNIKTTLSASNEVSRELRKKVQNNPHELINKFNIALDEIRAEINRVHKGKDILFIVDGSEKIYFDIYKRLFTTDYHIIQAINANIISAVPIHVHYDAEQTHAAGIFESYLLPVIKINKESIKDFRKIITKRIDEDTFFENPEVLNYFTEMSGGIVRQFTNIVNFALLHMEGNKINLDEAKEITKEYGRLMSERLDTEQKKILRKVKNKKIEINPANKENGKLIFNLFLIKYNGSYSINPVLENFI